MSKIPMERPIAVLAFLILCGISALHGQALPSVTNPTLAAFAEFSGGETGVLSDKALGGEIGAYFQPASLIGVEARAGGLRVKASNPFYFLTVGPRVQKSFPLVTAYAYAGLGIAKYHNAAQVGQLEILYPSKYDLTLQAAVGIDHSFGKFSWRVADFTISRAKGDSNPISGGAYPWQLSTGIRVRFGR